MKIKDTVLLVTGSNRGIGRAIVEDLVKGGAAKVYAAARNVNALKDLAAASKGKVVALTLDVTRESEINAAAKTAADVQVLINNAGIANYTPFVGAPDITSARQEMEVNYFGVLNMTRAFAPILKKNGGGVLVNVASIVSHVPAPAFGTYCASKAAVHSLTQSVRGELKAQGTFVIGVYPGPIDTDMAAGVQMEKESPQSVAREVSNAIESGLEDVFPDKGSKGTAAQLKADAKAVEKAWSAILPPETVEA